MEAGNVSFISSISNVMHSPQLSLVWAMWYQWFYPSDSKYSIGGRLISTPFRFRDSNNFPLENSSRYTLCWFILSHWLSWWLSGKEPTRQCRWSSAMQEAWVWSLVQEDPLEKEMATHSNILAWEISWTEEPGWIQFTGSQKTWIRLSDWAPTHFMLSVNVVVLFRH